VFAGAAALALVIAASAAPPQTLDARDPATVRSAASLRYMSLDFTGALDAWNRIGEPHINDVHVHDATRTRESVVRHLAGLDPGDLLTRDRYERAWRRLRELPAATATLTYAPLGNGTVDVDITLDERTLAPSGMFGLGEVGGKAIILHDIEVPLSNLLRQGDVLTTAFRWPADWRRFLVDWSAPSPRPMVGLTDVQGLWERQTYDVPGAGSTGLVTEDHAQAGLALADWVGGVFRWQAGVSFDRWNDRHHVGVTGSADVRLLGDRLSIGTEDAAWRSHESEPGFGRADVWVGWRSTPNPQHPDVTLFAEGSTTSASSPFDLWSGAGEGRGRPALLRAHTVLEDNVIGGPFFGRTLVHFTGEYHHPIREVFSTTIRWALFADSAHAWHRVDGTQSTWPVDVGAGVRWGVPGLGSEVRLDLARGLRDGGWAISIGWQAPWPRQ
jgi:hypothetical protein